MIKFFRRIRYRLASERKLSKYLLYAIGEIFLVVIGILIALQINNWNENRKSVILEKEMFKSLKAGMQVDIKDIKENINSHKKALESQNIIIQWLDDELTYSDSLCNHFAFTNMFTVFVADRSTFETFKAKGLNLISRDSLRDRISYLYEYRYEMYLKREMVYNKLIEKMINDVNSKYFSDSFMNIENPKSIIGCMHPNNPQKLKSSNEYKYFIKTNKEFNLFLINTMEQTRKNLKELISMIDYELEIDNQ